MTTFALPGEVPPALPPALQMALPLWIDRMRSMTDEQRAAVAHRCANTIASSGDNILFPSKRRGASATAFNALAEGLAALAFSPGGVQFGGLHFEAIRHAPAPDH